MKEARGNILDLFGKVDCICVTTNGFVKKNGEAVMGRGIALAIKNILPNAAKLVGETNMHNKYVEIIGPNATPSLAL